MIKTYEKLRIVDEAKDNDFFAEVNWESTDERTGGCKIIKFTFPNGQTAFVKRELLNAFLFTIGSADDQRDMVPKKIIRTKEYETVVSIEATKDIFKGQKITFPLKLSLPMSEDEVIDRSKRNKVK